VLDGRGTSGTGLDRTQRVFLLEGFRQDLADQVDDAEHRGITEKGAALLSLTRSLIRWLERDEPPGPEAVPLLERFLGTIARNPDEHESAERGALVAAIHDLGGDDRAAAEVWREPAQDDPEALAAFGRTLHRLMGEADLTVAGLAHRAKVEPSAVVAFLCGTEEAKTSETLRLAGALGVPVQALFEGLQSQLHQGVDRLPSGGLNPRGRGGGSADPPEPMETARRSQEGGP
jgi:transcriptional regulator with XRE-family HTH domain